MLINDKFKIIKNESFDMRTYTDTHGNTHEVYYEGTIARADVNGTTLTLPWAPVHNQDTTQPAHPQTANHHASPEHLAYHGPLLGLFNAVAHAESPQQHADAEPVAYHGPLLALFNAVADDEASDHEDDGVDFDLIADQVRSRASTPNHHTDQVAEFTF